MHYRVHLPVAFVCILLSVALAGCREVGQAVKEAGQAAEADRTSESLKLLGKSFHNHHDFHGKFPAGWEELIAFEGREGSHASVYEQLRDDGCVVTGWGLHMRDITVGSANFVLAYMPDAARNGGPALHAEGSVFHVHAADLQQALNAQKDVKPAQ